MGSNRYLMKVDMAALWVWLVLQTGDRWSRWTREEGQGWGWTEKSVLSICSLRSWWQEVSVHPAPAFRLLVPREIYSLSGTSAAHHMETKLSNRISSFIKLKGTQAPLHTYKFHTSLMASYTAHYHHTIYFPFWKVKCYYIKYTHFTHIHTHEHMPTHINPLPLFMVSAFTV